MTTESEHVIETSVLTKRYGDVVAVSDLTLWVGALPTPFVRTLGVVEILGAIGVVLPAATGVLPSLTVAAAGGLVAMMLLAIHFTRREWPNIGLNIVLGALAFAVAYGRSVIEPF